MTFTVLMLLVGFALLTAGAESLIRGGASLARRLGLSPLVVGLTVVAFGTSAPELFISVGGALSGQGDVALGNVVGSNIFNVGVILAFSALISPIRIKLSLLKLDAPLMVGISILGASFASFEIIPRWAGLLLVTMLIVYLIFTIRVARTQNDPIIHNEFDSAVPNKMRSIAMDLLLVVMGLTLLVMGSNLLVDSATTLALAFGLSEAIIGLTIVAAGTSLPELATSLIAGLRGQSDIAIGNVIGSNIFNILGILGITATIHPLSAPGISGFDLLVMVIYSIALLPLLWTGRILQRWEGALLFAGYLAYLAFLWPAG